MDIIITEPELGQQEILHFQQVTSDLPVGTAIPGAPAWFGQVMVAALGPLNVQMDNINARRKLDSASFKLMCCSQLKTLQETLRQIFPATLGHLNRLTNLQRRQMLLFYGRRTAPANTRETLLKQKQINI